MFRAFHTPPSIGIRHSGPAAPGVVTPTEARGEPQRRTHIDSCEGDPTAIGPRISPPAGAGPPTPTGIAPASLLLRVFRRHPSPLPHVGVKVRKTGSMVCPIDPVLRHYLILTTTVPATLSCRACRNGLSQSSHSTFRSTKRPNKAPTMGIHRRNCGPYNTPARLTTASPGSPAASRVHRPGPP